MAENIDYYFTLVSPFAWMGHQQLLQIAGKHGVAINFKPVNLAGVWEVSGGVPPAQRTPTRQRYRLIELQRIAEQRGLHLNVMPQHFPTNPLLADCCVIAITEAGSDPADFAFSVGEAVWSRQLQVADEAVIAELLEKCGHDPAAIIARAGTEEIIAKREANTKAAIDADAIGSPAYVYKDEVFWGQDRLDLLDRMIASGRDAYSSNF